MSETPDRLYLDSCVLNRLTDDQRQPRIRSEAVAVERILDLAASRAVQWIGSSAVRLELSRNPHPANRSDSLILLDLASEFALPTLATEERARLLHTKGFGKFDALHLALAEQANATNLLTVDNRFLQRAGQLVGSSCKVENPVDWLRRRYRWLLKP